MRLETEIALQFALGLLETFSRRDFAMVLAGVRHTSSGQSYDRLLDRWRRQHLLSVTGRGAKARFRIADRARERIPTPDPVSAWDRRWDGKWRVFSFDLPECRRRDRLRLWRHLREARFGLLQRSVWIWPHDAERDLRAIVEVQGIPECFCGLECGRLFLCDVTELVASSWDWKRIAHDHEAYLHREAGKTETLRRLDGVGDVARAVQRETAAYRAAFFRDPLLPRSLWPESYQGLAVQQQHESSMAVLRERIRKAARIG